MFEWPSTLLPAIQLQFQQDTNPSVIRTEMTSGRVRQRQRFTVEIKVQAVRWMFTDFQYAMFQSFFRYKLHQGADYFLIDLPFGDGLQEVQARFVNGVYKASYQEPHWVVTATLEVEEVPTVTEETFDFFLDLDDDLALIEQSAEHLHNCVHVVLPEQFY